MRLGRPTAVAPIKRAQWEERLAACVKTSFAAGMPGSGGQFAIQCLSKLTTAALLLFGASAVIDGEVAPQETGPGSLARERLLKLTRAASAVRFGERRPNP